MAAIQTRPVYKYSTADKSCDVSPLTLYDVVFDRVLSFLDFHDLTQLLKAGTASLTQKVLKRAQLATIGSFNFGSGGYRQPLLPASTFATLSTFQRLETVRLISPSWVYDNGKSSPLLQLSPTLRHLTVSVNLKNLKYASHFLGSGWSERFADLRTLRVQIASPPVEKYCFKLNVKKLSLPPTLRVLSILSAFISNASEVALELSQPIGYKMSSQHKKSLQTLSSWSVLYNAHSDPDRQSYVYNLPHLRFLELTCLSAAESAKETMIMLPDLSILPPSLESLAMHTGQALIDVHYIDRSHAALDPMPTLTPSSLRTLIVTSLMTRNTTWPACIPPSVTRLVLPTWHSQVDFTHLPSLFHPPLTNTAVSLWSPSVQRTAGFCNTFTGLDQDPTHWAGVTEFSCEHYEDNYLWEDLLTLNLPNLRSLKCSSSSTRSLNASRGPDFSIDRFQNHYSFLVSLDLRLIHMVGTLEILPRSLTHLEIWAQSCEVGILKLKGCPPCLNTFVLSTSMPSFVVPKHMVHLPKTLTYLQLPPILVRSVPRPPAHSLSPISAATSASSSKQKKKERDQASAAGPTHQVDFDFYFLPPDCLCVLEFVTIDNALDWTALPLEFRGQMVLVAVEPHKSDAIVSPESFIL